MCICSYVPSLVFNVCNNRSDPLKASQNLFDDVFIVKSRRIVGSHDFEQ